MTERTNQEGIVDEHEAEAPASGSDASEGGAPDADDGSSTDGDAPASEQDTAAEEGAAEGSPSAGNDRTGSEGGGRHGDPGGVGSDRAGGRTEHDTESVRDGESAAGPREARAGRGREGTETDGSGSAQETEPVALREEFDDLNDRHLRLVAEFNNFRRRSEQERLSAWARAQADLVASLLDVLDDLQRVADLDLSNATVEAIMEGIDLVERKFLRQLTEAGVETIDPEGEVFDPERMEAMMRVPAEEDEQVDTVAQVFQKGYSLKGILVRPARVSVYTQG